MVLGWGSGVFLGYVVLRFKRVIFRGWLGFRRSFRVLFLFFVFLVFGFIGFLYVWLKFSSGFNRLRFFLVFRVGVVVDNFLGIR